MFQKTSSFPLATVQLYRKIGNGSSFVDKFLCVLPETALVLRKPGEENNQKLKKPTDQSAAVMEGGSFMKINPTAAYHAYNKISEHLRPARMEETAGQPVQTGKTDQIQISPEAARSQEVEQYARTVTAELCRPASQQRLDALRTAIQNGEYHIPTEKLADAMMKKWLLA